MKCVPVLMLLFPCHRFSFCQYPFILSLAAKREILQRDSEQQMIVMARVGGFSVALQIHCIYKLFNFVTFVDSLPFSSFSDIPGASRIKNFGYKII